MKTIEYAGLIKVLLLAGLLSCNNSEPQAISTMSADVQVSDVEPGMVIASNAREAEKGKPFNSYTEDMQKLVLSYEGVVRNVNLGMSRSEVKGTEKATLVGENKRSVSYKEEISPLEYVDVDYYFDAQDRLDAISLHIFLDND